MRNQRGAFNIGVGFGFIICMLGILFFPSMLSAFDDMGKTSVTSIAAVTTGVGVGNASMILGHELLADNTDSVQSIESTNSNDAPAPAAYASVTKALTISGLQANATHTLSVDYYTDRPDNYLDTLLKVAPVLVFIIWLAIGGIVIWRAW